MKDRRLNQVEGALENLESLQELGAIDDVTLSGMWKWGNSPLGGGRHAAKFQAQLRNILLPRILEKRLRGSEPARLPDVDSKEALLFGYEVGTGKPVYIPWRNLTRHMLLVGSSGSGKTNCIWWIIEQALKYGN